MKRILIFILLTGFSFSFLMFYSFGNRKITGRVFADSMDIPFARVRLQASDSFRLTDTSGKFELNIPESHDSLVITAWAEGHFNSSVKVSQNDNDIRINLHKLYDKDNPDYTWTSPCKDENNKGNCGNCHPPEFMDQWDKSAHANSARNPYFLALYYGKDTSLLRDCGIGYKKDFPDSKGDCATCHIPGAAVHDPWGIDPLSVTDVNKNGVFCDVCHKIKDVELSGDERATGILSIHFLRPPKGKNVFFGPYDDVNEPDAYLPLIKKSEFCAACHSTGSWDNKEYNSYNEWKNSPYRDKGIQCQTCHMAPDKVTTNFAPGKGGLERSPLSISTHSMAGSRDPHLLANALTMNLSAEQKSGEIKVMVTLYNNKTGHHIPTEVSSRNMILLVDAANEQGDTLTFLKGETVPLWGGKGRLAEGNYSGIPGKGFAKVLQDSAGHFPAPFWRPARILSDNRIAAFCTDTSFYYFRIPGAWSRIRVKAKLIYRRFYKETMKEKGFVLNDIIMESDSADILPQK